MFLTSTPKKAVLYQSNSIKCLICATFLEESTDRIAVFGRSKWDVRGTICKILGGDLQTTNQESQYVCKTKCFPKLRKVEKMSCDLKNLEQELRGEILRNAVVRIKRGLSQQDHSDQTQGALLAPTQDISNPIKKTLFPSSTSIPDMRSLPPYAGYQVTRPSLVPVLMRAFPACVNNTRNFSPEQQTREQMDIPALPMFDRLLETRNQ